MGKETSEIAKLTERIAKDPRSKLFVPLAEEYKKVGDVEMAIHVLSEGLKNNPGYVTARSFLGRLLLEQGDLAAAQHEFEEVVKTIPDNLLAQKKLGDLLILQNRTDEALKHYKIALALNPGDKEFAALVADAEAGHDVKERIRQSKSSAASEHEPEKAPVKSAEKKELPLRASQPAQAQPVRKTDAPALQTAAAGPAPKETVAPVKPQAASPEPPAVPAAIPVETKTTPPVETPSKEAVAAEPLKTEALPSDAAPAATKEEAVLAAPLFAEEEQAEEVLVIEPLEEETPAPVVMEAGEEIPSVGEQGAPAEAIREEGPGVEAFHEPPAEEPAAVLKEDFESPLFPEAPPEAEAVPVAAEPAAAPQAEADDFTTDTLAELYIQQGFYEKAIDIYERMLAEKPDSRGLKDKLERVRAMASEGPKEEAAPATEQTAAEESTEAIFAEAGQFEPPAAKSGEEEVTLEGELFVEPEIVSEEPLVPGRKPVPADFEPREYVPPAEPEEEVKGKAVEDIFSPPAREYTPPEKESADFEPREYVPPDARQKTETAEPVHAAPGAGPAGKKETIDRLEKWLSNIKKEK